MALTTLNQWQAYTPLLWFWVESSNCTRLCACTESCLLVLGHERSFDITGLRLLGFHAYCDQHSERTDAQRDMHRTMQICHHLFVLEHADALACINGHGLRVREINIPFRLILAARSALARKYLEQPFNSEHAGDEKSSARRCTRTKMWRSGAQSFGLGELLGGIGSATSI